MTGPLPPEPPTHPPGRGGHLAVGRALGLLVVAVVLGVLMLAVGSRPPARGVAPVATTTTSTVPPKHHRTVPTTTTTTVPHASVHVEVANGTTTSGAAAFYTQKLQAQGWSTMAPVDTTSSVNASAVYYAAGQQSSAEVIAGFLGLAPSSVQPLTTSVPVSQTSGVDVLVVVGPNLASSVSTTTTS